MTRVKDDSRRDAERLNQQRAAEQADKKRDKSGTKKRQQFSQKLAGKTAVQTKQTPAAPAKPATGRAAGAAQSALLARAGITSNRFAASLEGKAKSSLGSGESLASSRTCDLSGKEEAVEERTADIDTRRDGLQARQRLDAIDGDEGGGGGRGSSAGHGGDGDSEHGGADEREESAKAAVAMSSLNDGQGVATPIVKPRQVANAPRLSTEQLEAIVSRVFAGLDGEGLKHFHIEFKGDQLGGLSLDLSAEGGKITARFTAKDKNLARLLKASEGPLARAFAHRGLNLHRFEVEGP